MNKQIEEMIKIIWDNPNMYDLPSTEDVAFELYNAGYRKQSDVAREIVTEFANMIKCHSFYMTDEYGEVNECVVTVKAINEIEAELRKKYESEGEE